MLPTSESSDIIPLATVNGRGNGFAHSEPEVATLKEAPKVATASIVPLPAEPVVPAATLHGTDVLTIYARAYDWTISERHSVLTIDHLLFALAERQIGASALAAGGVTGIGDLEVELLNLVHKSPVNPLVEGARPTVDNAVLGVLDHALGYARQNGRAASNTTDLLNALLDVLRKGETETPGLAALRRRWSRATEVDDIRQVLARILELQSNQPGMLAKVLAVELTAVRDRLSTLERRTLDATLAPRSPWYRRLNVLLIALGMVAASTGFAIWSFGT